ncbi:MAG: 4-hydroxy-tetrahydrodipicolinate synthase [Succinivibrio sp.]|nr:4-hydroxy-tetrahydrodipicolinate synthase [Succinivibrio sp.]
MSFKPHGIITPVLTALDEQENFSEENYKKFIDHLIRSGVHGIFSLGTNGEFYAFNAEEKLKIIRAAVEAVDGRVPVYAGTGCVTTKETVELSKEVEAMGGIDCLSVISPYFTAIKQDDLYRHYKAVATAVKLPVLLYNIPARTGNNIDYKTVAKLAQFDNVIGIKDSSGNFDNTLKYIENTNPRLSVLAGSDSLILWTLKAGGDGAISGCSNVFPELMASIYNYFKAGDFEKANEAQKKIRPFRNVMQMGNPNSVVKRAAQLKGFNVGPARAPSNIESKEIDNALLEVFKLYD